ncbi:hypothetical protein [Nitratireductor alexandrii]|uniref:hypothetical protein n=1 Tax=Nitratireductor alexandrii TaxID=2448161 RepID=UPI0013DF83A8|nr:hypothetical protein [Nitratireductor alexandrii]
MLKISLISSRFWPPGRFAGETPERDRERWRRDPLSHPSLRCLSQRELGDLPFPWR